MNAPSGTLSRASATGTSYGVDVPRRLRMDIAAASAPPSSPSRAITMMSPPVGLGTSVPVGQLSRMPSALLPSAAKHSGMMVGFWETPAMVMPTRTAMHRASSRMMFRKLRSLSC